MSLEDLSQTSFDFDYNEYESEGAPSLSAMSTHSNNPYFGFGLEMTLDSEGDLIFPDETLNDDIIRPCISTVGPVINSFKHAFVKLDASSKRLGDIELLSQYIHLRNINLSDNRIQDLMSLSPITYLQVLNAEGNRISTVSNLPNWKFLQALNLARNEISSTAGFPPNTIVYLNLSRNRLTTLTNFLPQIFPNLLVLELRENALISLEGIALPKLEKLYVAGNQLENLKGIEKCPNLKILHCRHNLISNLQDFPTLPHLEYINLRNNLIDHISQVGFLGHAVKLKAVVLNSNPIASNDNYRKQVIIACPPSLRRLDKFLIPETEQAEAMKLRRVEEKNKVAGIYGNDKTLRSSANSVYF